MSVDLRIREVRAGYERGWAFLPLVGKQPIEKGWPTRPRPTLEQCEEWVRRGNVGLRTGRFSGLDVVDLDPGCKVDGLDLPDTVTVVTGSGGHHLYYLAPEGVSIPNSAGKLGEHIDVRGEGGQVVFVGSVHPNTGQVYRWAEGLSPDDVDVAPLPQWIVDCLTARSQPGGGDGCTPYGLAALERELQTLRATPQGRRNNELNRAAFVLGQLIAGGELDGPRVQQELLTATDLPEAEATATIASGLKAGLRDPRSAPASTPAPSSKPGRRETVLVPGSHLDDKGNHSEVSEAGFARSILDALPDDGLYRCGQPAIPGQLLGECGHRYFCPIEIDGMRLLVSDHVRLVKWVKAKGADTTIPRLCDVTRTLAGLVREEARTDESVRDLELIVAFPAHGCSPGWNTNGIYYDQARELEGLKPETHREIIDNVLEDLLVDFPFQDEASRQNFIGLMLTLLLRPAIDGNVPLSLVVSSLERTGKTKLIEEVLGGVLLGYPTPALQLSGGDEEIDKRIVGLLLKAKPLVHLDNLRAYVDSGALASLITASTYQGRALGTNSMPELRNRPVLVASGNNVAMSSEMAKRTVPIILQPKDDAPELREDFQHSDLRAYVREHRRLVLECLLGMIANWETEGRPKGTARLGGFEAWAEAVGGVMATQGYRQWLGNLRQWQRAADPHGEDLATFVDAWRQQHGTGLTTATQLMSLAEDNNVFLGELRGATERARLSSFTKRVLSRHKDRPVDGLVVRHVRTNQQRFWKLDPAMEGCRDA